MMKNNKNLTELSIPENVSDRLGLRWVTGNDKTIEMVPKSSFILGKSNQ